MGNEINYMMKVVYEASQKMSETQQKKVVERIQKAGEAVQESAVLQDMINDAMLKKK